MFEVGVVAQFEAAHRLVGNFGPAQRVHGHTYRVEATVHGPILKTDGTLFDITLLQDALGTVVKQLHYQNLDEIDGLNARNTTAEVVAEYIWQHVAPALTNVGLIDLRIAVWESPNAWAAVMRELPQ
ncbi:MAG: 6-pyruvoyl trahydropterin synthase family protein [Roseiflexaceae bacterium]|jgi:6-pyruvoyltetrahydropterin/6-carboxytetrahydropterin synthase